MNHSGTLKMTYGAYFFQVDIGAFWSESRCVLRANRTNDVFAGMKESEKDENFCLDNGNCFVLRGTHDQSIMTKMLSKFWFEMIGRECKENERIKRGIKRQETKRKRGRTLMKLRGKKKKQQERLFVFNVSQIIIFHPFFFVFFFALATDPSFLFPATLPKLSSSLLPRLLTLLITLFLC